MAMTKKTVIIFSLAILYALVNSPDAFFDNERAVGVPFYRSANNGRLISPRIRHFHPRLPAYEDDDDDDDDIHYQAKHRDNNRQVTQMKGQIKYSKSKPPKDKPDEVCPEFAHEIGNVTQALGRDAKLVCNVNNLGRFRVAWMRIETNTILTVHDQVISENYRIRLSHRGHRVYVLHINNVEEKDQGFYMCQINTHPMLSQIGYLDVQVPPHIIEELSSSDMFVNEGTNVTLECHANGHPEPKLTWHRVDYRHEGAVNWQKSNNTQIIQMADDRPPIKNDSFHEGSFLKIRKVSRLHMGAYLCIASNDAFTAVSWRIILHVNFPPTIWNPNQLVSAKLGSSVTLECNTESYPESINYWSRNKSEMISHGGKYDVIVKVTAYKTKMMLTIRHVVRDDYGVYHCFAHNPLGQTESTILLYATDDVDPNYRNDHIKKELEADEKSPKTSIKIFSEKEEAINSAKSGVLCGTSQVIACIIIKILTSGLHRYWT